MRAMDAEWVAWRQLCMHLQRHGIDPNASANVPLVAAVKVWGEEVAALRRLQDRDKCERWRIEAHDVYEPYVIRAAGGGVAV